MNLMLVFALFALTLTIWDAGNKITNAIDKHANKRNCSRSS